MKKSRTTLFLLFFFLFWGCASKPPVAENGEPDPSKIAPQKYEAIGTSTIVSDEGFDATYDRVRTLLEGREGTEIVAEIDHQRNAASVDLTIDPTRVILFHVAKETAPLLTENRVAGLDRPLRVLVFERNAVTYVVTESATYMANRHQVSSPASFDLGVLGARSESTLTPENAQGVVSVTSKKTVNETYDAFKTLVTNNENLNVMAEHDFKIDGSAAKLLVFGNPKLGTPLMQDSPTVALDLPQKVLVFEAEKGEAIIAYNDPKYLAFRHGVNVPEVIQKISGALSKLSSKAAE